MAELPGPAGQWAGQALLALALGACAWLLPDRDVSRLVLVSVAALIVLWPGRNRPRTSAAGAVSTWHVAFRERTALVLALVLALSVLNYKDDLTKLTVDREIRIWNVFHYYLGSKYFAELGYSDLYRAALAADRESGDYWCKVGRVRNLDTYEVEKRSANADRYRPRERFSPERWQQFEHDTRALAHYREAKEWRNVFRDRGYNGTPVWTAMGRGIAAVVSPTEGGLRFLASIDLMLLAATFWLMVRSLGLSRALMLGLLFVSSPVNAGRLVGGFLQYDWLCAGVASVCLYRLGKTRTAGFLAAWAVMTRVFPVFFVVATVVPGLVSLLRHRRLDRRISRYLFAFVVSCTVLLGVGLLNGRGATGWLEFARAITTHSDSHATGDRRVGLEHLTAHGLGWGGAPFDLDAGRSLRAEYLELQRPLLRLLQVGLLLLLVLAALRLRSWRAQVLGVVAVFALLVVSRYYSSFLILLPLAASRGSRSERFLAGGQLLVNAAYYASRWADASRFESYGVLNLALVVYLVAALVGLIVGPIVAQRSQSLARTSCRSARPRILDVRARLLKG